jgi:hypothetical protein
MVNSWWLVPLRGIKNAKLKMQNAEYTWLSRFEDGSIISAALH